LRSVSIAGYDERNLGASATLFLKHKIFHISRIIVSCELDSGDHALGAVICQKQMVCHCGVGVNLHCDAGKVLPNDPHLSRTAGSGGAATFTVARTGRPRKKNQTNGK
jgi:hypothetical protein